MENLFFGRFIDPMTLGGKSVFLLLAVLIGGLIGFERQFNGNAAGMRTHIMVCLGSAIITFTSVEIGLGVRGGMRGDPGHIAAQIVSGIGFLGAGAIMRDGTSVHGLTTAASVWVTAGIGIALGASPRLAEMAVITAPLVLGTLVLVNRFEQILKLKQTIREVSIEIRTGKKFSAQLFDMLFANGITVFGVVSDTHTAVSEGSAAPCVHMKIRLKFPRNFDQNQFTKLVMQVDGVIACRFDE